MMNRWKLRQLISCQAFYKGVMIMNALTKFLKANKLGLFIFVLVILMVANVIVVSSIFSEIKEEKAIEAACGGNGIWVMNSDGNATYVSPETYVEEKVWANELAQTNFTSYTKEGEMTLFDIDCDVKEAFEILNCVRMYVTITIGDRTLYRAYAKGSDGYTYLVETDSNGSILRDDAGNAFILQRCDFADLYLGSED